MTATVLRRVALFLLLTVLGFALLTARAVANGTQELAISDGLFDQGNVVESLAHARSAAGHYVPGAPHVLQAYDRMVAIARGAERAGDWKLSAQAWASVRGAALQTRHVLVPMADFLTQADQNLARLRQPSTAASLGAPAPLPSLKRPPPVERADRPGVGATYWGAALFLGFFLAVSGLALTVVRGVRPDGKLSADAVRWGAILVAAGAACWTIVVLWA